MKNTYQKLVTKKLKIRKNNRVYTYEYDFLGVVTKRVF